MIAPRPRWFERAPPPARLVVALAIFACAPAKKAEPYPKAEPPGNHPRTAVGNAGTTDSAPVAAIASYFERKVDLQPFLTGFPYMQFEPSLETNTLFFIERGERYTLKAFELTAALTTYALESAKTISTVDWSRRSLWSMHHHAPSNTLWLHADASNDEQMNLWRLDLASGSLSQVTHADYMYGFGFSEDDTFVAYTPRTGKKAPYSTCLHVREIKSGTDKKVVCDSPELSFTWSEPVFSPDNLEIYFNAQLKGDRNRVQLVRVRWTTADPTVEVLTDRKVKRSDATAVRGWVGAELAFVANDDGFSNLFTYSRETAKIRQLSRFREDITSARLAGREVVVVHETPAGSTLALIDVPSAKQTKELELPGSAAVLDAHGSTALVSQRAPDLVFEALALDLSRPRLEPARVVGLSPELEQRIVQCKVERVEIPTFDNDRRTRRRRKLHAFSLTPKRPLEDPAQRLALITAFYGGANVYRMYDHVLCAAGLTIVSPSVRGSDGFGYAFSSLNDRDLGGDEIIDLFYVARWLEGRGGLPARRIGVYGRSHGGYATMRALTFVPATNKRNEFYPFGFGIAEAGFSSIKSFYDATNIPDWVVLESGDPNDPDDLAAMIDRSPLTHVDRLVSPLLVVHGERDWRVPVSESRQFVAAAKARGKPVMYVEFQGQGHAVEGVELEVQAYEARFDFLEAIAKAAPSADSNSTSTSESSSAP